MQNIWGKLYTNYNVYNLSTVLEFLYRICVNKKQKFNAFRKISGRNWNKKSYISAMIFDW